MPFLTAGAGNVKRARVTLENPLVQDFKQHKLSDLAKQDEGLSNVLESARGDSHDGAIFKSIGGLRVQMI